MKQIEPDEPGFPGDLAARLEQERLRQGESGSQAAARGIEERGPRRRAQPGCRRSCGIPPAITIWAIFLGVARSDRGGVFRRLHSAAEAAGPDRGRGARAGAGAAASGGDPGGRARRTRASWNCPATSRPSPKLRFWRAPTDMSSAAWWTSAIGCKPASRWRKSKRPNWIEQVRQAKANLQQAQAAVDQAQANYQQGKADMELARVTAQRWTSLAAKGVVSRQENDQYQASINRRLASLQSLEKAIAVQRSNVAAAEANLARLEKMQSYRVVKAPFDGVITLRNVDVGALVNAGSTLLFRIAQTAHAAHLRERAAGACQFHSCRPSRATERFEPAGAAVHGHGRADGERARSRQPHAAGGGSRAESRRRAAARHVCPGGSERARGPTRPC